MNHSILSIIDQTDLELAAAVQKAMLTGPMPGNLANNIFVKNRMSGKVGGDFYTVQQLNSDQIAFTLGDVMGHGTSAALVMTQVIGLLNISPDNRSHPQCMVEIINEMLVRLGRQVGYPVTCSLIYGVVDLPSGILFYINAGHPCPLVLNRKVGIVYKLEPTTMLLGVKSNIRPESCHQFFKHDRFILFTDGIVDGRNQQGELFGIPRFQSLIQKTAAKNGHNVLDDIFAGVKAFNHDKNDQLDDQTVMIIDFTDGLKPE